MKKLGSKATFDTNSSSSTHRDKAVIFIPNRRQTRAFGCPFIPCHFSWHGMRRGVQQQKGTHGSPKQRIDKTFVVALTYSSIHTSTQDQKRLAVRCRQLVWLDSLPRRGEYGVPPLFFQKANTDSLMESISFFSLHTPYFAPGTQGVVQL